MKSYENFSSSGASVEKLNQESSATEESPQQGGTNSWSSMENFVNTSLFSSPLTFTSSIWSPSAPSTGGWKKDPSLEKDTYLGGWASTIVKKDAEKKTNDSGDAPSSLVESLGQMSLETQRPFLPSCLDSPKNALTMWYGQRYKNYLQFKTNECFTTWDDGGKPHEVKFTSIFTCPVSGEHFASGKYGKERDMYIVLNDEKAHINVVWYCTLELLFFFMVYDILVSY